MQSVAIVGSLMAIAPDGAGGGSLVASSQGASSTELQTGRLVQSRNQPGGLNAKGR